MPDPPAEEAEIDERFVEEAKQIVAEYKQWGRVDDEFRWAPWLCRLPEPGRPSMSKAGGGGHAKKLYSLFAKDRLSYVSLAAAPEAKPAAKTPAIGQVIVKESWIPETVAHATADDHRGRFGSIAGGIQEPNDHFDRYLREGDTWYRAASIAGLYMMFKKPKTTEGTDDGWVYATVTTKGVVTSAGRVASCMKCHASAKHERLFGLGGGQKK